MRFLIFLCCIDQEGKSEFDQRLHHAYVWILTPCIGLESVWMPLHLFPEILHIAASVQPRSVTQLGKS